MLFGYINTDSLYNIEQTWEKDMYSRVSRKALSLSVRLLSLVWVLFLELSKEAEFVPLKNSYSLLCHGCMGGGLCAEHEEGRSERANKLIK